MTTAELLQTGRAAWPDIAIDAAAFERFVAARAPDDASRARLHAADLYLACGCAAGDPVALAAFERVYLAQVPDFLRGVRASPELADEVRQRLRDRLFVGDTAKIADYSGRGTLGSWLRVVALRTASNLRRAEGARDRIEARAASPAVPLDPELALIRARYAADFERALRDAFAALPERERNLLRLHLLDGLGVDGLAPVFGVHRATAARWLSAARAQLQEGVLELLGERLALDARDVESLARVVRSDLDLSLRSVLGATAAPSR